VARVRRPVHYQKLWDPGAIIRSQIRRASENRRNKRSTARAVAKRERIGMDVEREANEAATENVASERLSEGDERATEPP